MHIIIELHPNGNKYGVFEFPSEARHVFAEKVQEWNEKVNNRENVGWDDYIILLAELMTPRDFGFKPNGEVYGMIVIDSLNWED